VRRFAICIASFALVGCQGVPEVVFAAGDGASDAAAGDPPSPHDLEDARAEPEEDSGPDAAGDSGSPTDGGTCSLPPGATTCCGPNPCKDTNVTCATAGVCAICNVTCKNLQKYVCCAKGVAQVACAARPEDCK
jgi:hypothetical protein